MMLPKFDVNRRTKCSRFGARVSECKKNALIATFNFRISRGPTIVQEMKSSGIGDAAVQNAETCPG